MNARSLRTAVSPLVLFVLASAASCSSDEDEKEVNVASAGRSSGGRSSGDAGSKTDVAGAAGKAPAKGGAGGAPASKGGAGGASEEGGAGGAAATSGAAGANAGGAVSTKGGSAGSGAGGAASSGGTAGSASGSAGAKAVPANHLAIVKPTVGQVHVQAGSPPIAEISYEVVAGADITSVEYVIETDFSLGTSTKAPGFALTYPYAYPGNRKTEARGKDASGKQIATATIEFVIKPPGSDDGDAGAGGQAGAGGSPPDTGNCYADLDAAGVKYTKTKARGVVDAIYLSGPLNGVLYAKNDSNTVSSDPLACEFVKTMYEFASLAKEKGFVKIGTLGAYCYRCCCAWSETNYCRGNDDPEPDCSGTSYSNHSFGRALDIRYLYKADGTRYDVNDPTDFVKSSAETCGAALAAQKGVSKELYALACEANARKIFGAILTPNYNSAHRNHFHCDIGKSGTPGSFSVKSYALPVIDAGPDGDELRLAMRIVCPAEHARMPWKNGGGVTSEILVEPGLRLGFLLDILYPIGAKRSSALSCAPRSRKRASERSSTSVRRRARHAQGLSGSASASLRMATASLPRKNVTSPFVPRRRIVPLR